MIVTVGKSIKTNNITRNNQFAMQPFSSPEPPGVICNEPVMDATENTISFIGLREPNAWSKLKI